jgi:hypothetical protein
MMQQVGPSAACSLSQCQTETGHLHPVQPQPDANRPDDLELAALKIQSWMMLSAVVA